MGHSQISLSESLSFFCIHAIIVFVCFSLATSAIARNETDRVALLEFKIKINHDPLGVMNSWNDTIHFCQWYGVTCGRRHQRVIILDLESLKLSGSISPHIGNLSFLRELYLQNNSFTHEIPPEIGHLRRLQIFAVSNNSIGGEIPSNISSCSNLITARFSYNQLVGEIPVELGSLVKLQILTLSKNNLIGSIPLSLGNLSSIETLSVAWNNLGGSIPNALGQLKNLKMILLDQNRLSGTIPTSIFNLSFIKIFDIGYNNLQGNLPLELGFSLPNVQYLYVNANQFTGSIPVSLSNASNLEELQLAENNLTGTVPFFERLHKLRTLLLSGNYLGSGGPDDLSFLFSLTNATALEVLTIDQNNFGGVLPGHISNFSTKLTVLTLYNNRIIGTIPTSIENLISLNDFQVWHNQLSGIIPSSIGKLQNLEILVFNENKFSGYVPSSLGNLTKLIQLGLGSNNLEGNIPPSLGYCQKLLMLDLSENNLSGSIPPQVISLSSLSIGLNLSVNGLIGALPMEVGTLKNLGMLDVSENMLSGEIPRSLGSCIKLEILGMSGNFFQGSIPSSFISLRGLVFLDVSRNNLSGDIPKFLAEFKTLLLNLSYNDLVGMVPIEGVFENASATFVMGNNKLCGGISEFHLPKCNLRNSTKMRHRLKSIIAIVSVLLGVTLVLSFIFLLRIRKNSKEPTSGSSGPLLWRVSYQSLLKATDGFSSSNMIGVGSFGTVYKVILDQGETLIAVKVLNLLHRGASRSFMAECEALRNCRHRNLVKLLTACSSVDYHGNDFKALVYDYMVNGSLEDWLRPPVGINEVDESPRNVNFLQRLNIAIDVACALEYLHHHCETPIVHCDLKPSNVLLDDEMTGHVGDFGLAKFLLQGSNNSTANQSSSVGVRGTIGYAPPEYGMGSEVSTYGDLYSYGILLLEMFTGKRPTNDMFEEGLNLHKFVKAALPDRVAEIVEPFLLEEREEGETSMTETRNGCHTSHVIQECLILVFEIGVACSASLPEERMNISDVVVKLHFVREKLLRTRIHGERRYARIVQSAGVQG